MTEALALRPQTCRLLILTRSLLRLDFLLLGLGLQALISFLILLFVSFVAPREFVDVYSLFLWRAAGSLFSCGAGFLERFPHGSHVS